ncbi:MAG: hypothetical protein Phog2KO_41700 [Phototrophicaceae bacterium]
MNDWDNFDNFPTDDDDNEDFDWLNEDDDSASDDDDLRWLADETDDGETEDTSPQEWQMPRSDRAERAISSQIEDAESADFGDTEQALDWMSDEGIDDDSAIDMPDWLSGMDVPSATDEEIAAAQANVLGNADSDWDDSPETDADAGWDLFAEEEEPETEADSWLASSDDSDDEVDEFLFGSSSDDSDDDAGWDLFAEEDSDNSTDDEAQDLGIWGDLGADEFEDEDILEPIADNSAWDLGDDDFDFGQDDTQFEDDSTIEQGELAVPDWLADMPLPEVLEPVERDEIPLPSADDLGIPDWLEGEEQPQASDEPVDELDFMNDLDAPVSEIPDDLGVPDWITDEKPSVEDAVSSNDLDDLLGDLDVSESDDDLGDLLASLDTDGDDADLDDLLASLDTDDEEVELDDLFASLDTDVEAENLDDLDFLEPISEVDDVDDLDFLEPISEADDVDDLDFLEPVSEADDVDDLDFLEPVSEADDVDDFQVDTEDEEDLEFSFLADVESVEIDDDIFAELADESDEGDIFADLEAEEDDELALLNKLSAMKTSDLDFMDGITRVQEGVEQGDINVDDLEDDELALLNKLNAMKTSDLDFMQGVSREAELPVPELDDDEIEVLNRLSAMRTSDLSFMEGITREPSEPEQDVPDIDDDELERLNELSKVRTSSLDFMDGITRVQEGVEQGDINVDDLEDDELALINKLSAIKTSDLDFMEGVSREAELPVPELDDNEIAILNRLSAMRTSELSFMEGITREASEPELDVPDIDEDELQRLDELSKIRTSDLDFMEGVSRDDDDFQEQTANNNVRNIDDEESGILSELSKIRTSDLDFMEGVSRDDDDFQGNNQADLDFFKDLDDSEDVQTWFDSQEEKKPTTGTLSFLNNIPDAIDDQPDWLDEISGIDTDTLREAAEISKKPKGVDIDALIDSFDTQDDNSTDDITSAADLDAIFGAMDEETLSQLPDDLPADALPDWLQEIAKGTDGASAAALVRQRRDRSLDDLDDRLLDLRERGLELSSSTSTDDPQNAQRLSKIVPNIDEALTPVRANFSQAGLITSPNVTNEQVQRANLLQGLVGSAIDADDTENERGSMRLLDAIVSRADRIVIALLLIAVVFIPFIYSGFDGIATLPPSEFAEDSEEFAAFTLIENIVPGQYVLVAAEYGATGARELDTATRSFLEHILTKGGIPVVVSSDAIGLLRAENILVELLSEVSRNETFYIGGFLPGGNIGLRDFAINLNSVVSSDLRGNETGLSLNSVDDFEVILLISESGETIRNWMEQVAPVIDTSIIVITGQAARPLALPYTSSSQNTVALLTGYDDAFTYQQMVLGLYNPSATPSPTETTTPIPTETGLPTSTDLPTNTPTATATASDTPIPSATPTASDTPIPSLTPRPATNTAEPEVSDTPLPPTATVVATDMPQVEVETIEIAVVSSETSANVRAGAGEGFAVVSSVATGQQLAIAERSEDGEWVRVILPDGSNGWISSSLLTTLEVPIDEFEGETEFNETLRIGTVLGDSRVNVRSGAGSEFEAIAGLDPNVRVRIIGTNEAGDWYNIVLPNGGEGWVASFLLSVRDVPEDEWDGASKDGFFPIYYDERSQVQQDADDDTLIIGRNAAGAAMPVYSDSEQSEILFEIANGAEFIVIAEGNFLTEILTEEGQVGFIETRVIVTEERSRDEVNFAPTQTLTPTIAPPTATVTATPTVTPSPFAPQLTPAPFLNPEARSSSQAFGLIVAIAIIAFGNLFWIFRWLGQREQ